MPAPIKIASTIALAVAASSVAHSAQLDYTLYAGIEHSNNINLSATNPISENVLTPGLNFSLAQQGASFQANAVGSVEYRDYLGGHFNNQTQAQLAGQANWTLLPQRLDFTVKDYASIQPIDSLVSNAPNNQQQTNVLLVGPTLRFRLGDTLKGQGELRYIDSHAQKTKSFNSQRGQAALRLIKDLNPTDQLSVNLETQRINFASNAGSPNYSRDELFGRYVSRLARFDLDAIVGWSKLDFDRTATQAISSPLVRVSVTWRPSERNTLSIMAARQYSDAAQGMLQQSGRTTGDIGGGMGVAGMGSGGGGGGGSSTNTGSAVVNSQVYLERRLELTYSLQTERLLLWVSPTYHKLSYSNDPTFNQTGRGGRAGLQYQLRPLLALSASAGYETATYQTLDRRDKSFDYDVSLTRQWTSHWSTRFSFLRQQRNSNIPNQGFRENQIYFGVAFKR